MCPRPFPSRAASLAAAAAGALALAGCASTPATSPAPPLDGTAWMLVELGAQSPAPDAPAPTLRFAGERVTGSDGCNRFVGPAWGAGDRTGDRGALRIGRDLASSRRPCGEAALAAAEAFSRTLARTVAYRRDGGSLALLDARGVGIATFVPQPSGLTGKVWRVLAYGDGPRAATDVRPNSLVTLEFDTEGRVRGFGGCSPYAGTWSIASRRLAIGALHPLGHDGCPGALDLKAQEHAVLRALSRATTLRQDGERLELRDASDAVVAAAAALPRLAAAAR